MDSEILVSHCLDPEASLLTDVRGVQLITLSHDRYEAAIPTIQASHIKSRSVQQRLQLKAATQRRGHLDAAMQRLPKLFFQEGEGDAWPTLHRSLLASDCWK